MCSSNSNEEKLFSQAVPVSITDGFSTYFRSLLVSIEWQKTSDLIMKKELFITLTDNNDPFFLYNLQLSDDDFQRLKSCQNLLIDFSAFPQTVIYFLKLCLGEAKNSQPKPLLHLIIGETIGSIAPTAQLDIEQSSAFRQVSLLSLKFLAATESTAKQHVTVGYRNLKEENQRLQNKLCDIEKMFREKVSDLESALENKSQDLESAKRDLNKEISERESQHAHTLMEEREKLLNKQREGEDRLESERIDRETKMKKDLVHLETRVSCLEKLNKELENKKIDLERQLNEQRSHNLSVENDLRIKSEALTTAEKNNSELLADFREASGRINHLMGNVKDQKDELKRKETQIASLQRDLDDSKKEKKKVTSSLSATEEQLKKEKRVRKETDNDHLKAKQIIEKYLFVNEALNDINIKLEKTSSKQEQVIQCLKNELEREKETNRRLAVEIQQVIVYQEKIAKLEEENRNLILYNNEVNKLVQEKGIITEYNPPPNFAEMFSIFEAINVKATGDNDLLKKENSAPTTGAIQSKSIPSRLGVSFVENGLKPETRQMRANLPADSTKLPVYNPNSLQPETSQMDMILPGSFASSTSKAFNAKVSTIIASDKNANESSLEIISNALSSEFKDLNISKHSTARKQTKSVKSRLPRKS